MYAIRSYYALHAAGKQPLTQTTPQPDAGRKSSFSFAELLECGHGRLFGPGNAQLPLPPMLMFERITHISDTGGAYGKGHIIAELDIKPDLWSYNFV